MATTTKADTVLWDVILKLFPQITSKRLIVCLTTNALYYGIFSAAVGLVENGNAMTWPTLLMLVGIPTVFNLAVVWSFVFLPGVPLKEKK